MHRVRLRRGGSRVPSYSTRPRLLALLLVDNIRTAHGREPFEGPREVVVAMADAVHLADCSPTIELTAS
jgi:hypothetical protein